MEEAECNLTWGEGEKEKIEKELFSQIIAEAEEHKVDFYRKRKVNCETNQATNREKEKVRTIFFFF